MIDSIKDSKRKFIFLLIQVLCITITCLLLLKYINIDSVSSVTEVYYVAEVTTFAVGISLILWFGISKAILTPMSVLLIVMIVFFMGQAIGWTLGIDLGAHDLTIYQINGRLGGVPQYILVNTIVYTCLGIQLFILGAMCSYKTSVKYKVNISKRENDFDLRAFKITAKWMTIVSAPAYFIYTTMVLRSVLDIGYHGMYEVAENIGKTLSLILYPRNWFEPAILILYICYHDNRLIKNISITFISFAIIFDLFVGGRSGAVMLALAFLIARHYMVKNITKNEVIFLGIGGYFFLGILNVVRKMRNIVGHGLIDYIIAIPAELSSVLGDFLSEMGWSMTSLSWTMQFVPSTEAYRHGITYLYGLLGVVPNVGIWETHPTALYADLAPWLQQKLGISYGPGYTMIAETYINFGWFGLITMAIWGAICCKVLVLDKNTAKNEYKHLILVILLISTILKAYVRSSFSVIIRTCVYTIMLIFVVQYFVKNHLKKMNELQRRM